MEFSLAVAIISLLNFSLETKKGETVGLVGESGCGKTTAGRVLVRLYEPSDGEVIFEGKSVHEAEGEEGNVLNRKMQMIFQDPQASLNPRMIVSDIIAEGLDIHSLVGSKKERLDRVHELLDVVGLDKQHANRYPHEFSGGQRQRIGVARALAVDPEFIVADEPVSALDVSIQAQVINLMRRLQEERDPTYLFISHDLSVVKYISDRVGVMYRTRSPTRIQRNPLWYRTATTADPSRLHHPMAPDVEPPVKASACHFRALYTHCLQRL
jgi:ABC-type oligopeptide transport system ATPase subunit